MLINPNNVIFENVNDIVDYVNIGLPPRKKYFEKVIDGIWNRPTADNPIDISEDLCIVDKEEFESVLRHIYELNCRKRNLMIIGGTVLAAVVIGVKVANAAKAKKAEQEFDEFMDDFIEHHSGGCCSE